MRHVNLRARAADAAAVLRKEINVDCQTKMPVTVIGVVTACVTAVDVLTTTVLSCLGVRISMGYYSVG